MIFLGEADAFSKINSSMKENVIKAVQAGVTNHLSISQLDEILKVDDNLINEIRKQLMLLSEKIFIDFGKDLEKIMEKMKDD
jgi:uncharacterized protein related to proFAR isomerase